MPCRGIFAHIAYIIVKMVHILVPAKVIKFGQLLQLLPRDTDAMAVLRSLQQVAMLVQGCWVVKSEILYPKDTFSSHSGVSSEILCRARNYVVSGYIV